MRRNHLMVVLVMLVFFVISFLTNILGALNQKVSESFTLTETMAGRNAADLCDTGLWY
ncbi:MAG: hypothetical protein ACK5HT_15140 [Draconibacterium sp.]